MPRIAPPFQPPPEMPSPPLSEPPSEPAEPPPPESLSAPPPSAPPPFELPPAVIPPPAPPPAPEAVAPTKTVGEIAVDAARSKLGSAYSFGSAGPDTFDCSGLVQWSYEQAGVRLPRTSYEQLASGTPISVNDLQLGDVLWFYGGSHSALYIGDGNVIHAGTYRTGVTITPISVMPFAGARRFGPDGRDASPQATNDPKPWGLTQVVAVSRTRR